MIARAMPLIAALALASCGGEEQPSRGEPAMSAMGGEVCGEDSLLGREIPRISPRAGGQCGIARPVELAVAGGVPLTGDVRLNCRTASRLDRWIESAVRPAIREHLGTELHSIEIWATYSCRTRNNVKGAKISEHGKGNAVDVAAFRLADGRRISVLGDWGKGDAGRALDAMHEGACDAFGVVLGPGADKFHRDHFHLDISGFSYCR